jgi:hypothetical protein
MTASLTKLCGLLIAILAAAGVVAADGPLISRDCTKVTCPPSRYCCPDDYVARPLPNTCPSQRGCVDDYCARPLPSTCPSQRGCVDDYCPKWFPKCLPGCLPPWFVCAPSGCGPCNTK